MAKQSPTSAALTVTHKNPDGGHVIAGAHDPGQADQKPAAIVYGSPADAAAVAELLNARAGTPRAGDANPKPARKR